MYKPKRQKYNNQSKSTNRFSFNKRIQGKKLDTNLFINRVSSASNFIEEVVQSSFSDYKLGEKLQRNIAVRGFVNPTPIQAKTIPFLLEGKDVIGIANTGTGKTAAFLIPLINKMEKDRNQRCLIVTPTRELAMQIYDEFNLFAKGMDLNAVLCIGGANIGRQEKKLHHNPHVVIGTPGRLKDLIQRKRLYLSLFQNIVLDEVDRMVDIGFIKEVEYLVSLLPKKRQSLFFSATVSPKVEIILQKFVTQAVKISVKQQDTAENIDQNIIRVSKHNKVEILHDLLISDGFKKVLIFGQTKWAVEKLTKALIDRGFKAAAIHGNKSQGQRQRALSEFKEDKIHILLATDVASRGLDIDNVTHVINYDTPQSYDDYIHRIGRTGRADKKGIALTFVE